MKIVLESPEDYKAVNWLNIAEKIAEHARKKIADVMTTASEQLKDLAPGEKRSFVIEIGTVEISREETSEGEGVSQKLETVA
jgi:hypothetical protein